MVGHGSTDAHERDADARPRGDGTGSSEVTGGARLPCARTGLGRLHDVATVDDEARIGPSRHDAEPALFAGSGRDEAAEPPTRARR